MAVISTLMNQLIATMEQKGSAVRRYLQPGLSRQEIDQVLSTLGVNIPDQLYHLYQWHNGIDINAEAQFLFGEYDFTPLHEAIADYQAIQQYYNDPDAEINLRFCFPFASFDGAVSSPKSLGQVRVRMAVRDRSWINSANDGVVSGCRSRSQR